MSHALSLLERWGRTNKPGTGLVNLVCLVHLVCLVFLLNETNQMNQMNQINQINKTNQINQPVLTGFRGLDSLQTIPVFYRDCVPSFLAV